MKKIAAIALAVMTLTGCDNAYDEIKKSAPSLTVEQVSNVCANMTKTYIQNQADKTGIGSKVTFMRYEGLDQLIERQCRSTSLDVRMEGDAKVKSIVNADLKKDIAEFANDEYSAGRYTFVYNAMDLAKTYAGKLAQSENKFELEIWIKKIKEVQ